jgi:nucleoid DNA-binding protein
MLKEVFVKNFMDKNHCTAKDAKNAFKEIIDSVSNTKESFYLDYDGE